MWKRRLKGKKNLNKKEGRGGRGGEGEIRK